MRTYREIFALPEFRVLFLARCVTMTTISVGNLALATITYADTGSPLLTALSLFGGPLITLVGTATVLGASDSIPPRRATTVMPLAYAVAYALQAIPGTPWGARFAILALPYLVGSATSGSTMRLLALVVPADGYVLGRATLNIAVGVTQIAGYGLGGLLLTRFSASTLFLGASAGALLTVLVVRFGLRERPAVTDGRRLGERTRAVNRTLLGSAVVRPVYLALWVPNGLIVGCEALYVPFGGSGYLFAIAATGMLVGDVLVGRVVVPHLRERLVEPLRLLLALPYLGFLFGPSPAWALVLSGIASIGYAAALPLQERLVAHTDPAMRGQVFGLYSTGLMVGQAAGAGLGGLIATWLSPSHAIGTMACLSLAVSVWLFPSLQRSAPAHDRARRTVPGATRAADGS